MPWIGDMRPKSSADAITSIISFSDTYLPLFTGLISNNILFQTLIDWSTLTDFQYITNVLQYLSALMVAFTFLSVYICLVTYFN